MIPTQNLVYGFNVIPTQISTSYFMNIDKLILKLMRVVEDPDKSKTIVNKE